MAIHSSIVAWRIPWTEEPGGLQAMGLQRIGQESTSAELLQSNCKADAFFIPMSSARLRVGNDH